VDRIGEAPEDLIADEPANKKLSGLGYSARLRNYWDLSEASNLEISGSVMTGRREQPMLFPGEDVNALLARQTTIGADLTFRWRPLQEGLYRSFIFQAEVMKQINDKSFGDDIGDSNYAGPLRDFTGAYAFARYQISRRTHLGGRFDWVQDPEADGARLLAGSGVLEFFPSEFSKLVASVERQSIRGQGGITRLLLQASFSVGPHKPHPF
jgi:hypothetical protein